MRWKEANKRKKILRKRCCFFYTILYNYIQAHTLFVCNWMEAFWRGPIKPMQSPYEISTWNDSRLYIYDWIEWKQQNNNINEIAVVKKNLAGRIASVMAKIILIHQHYFHKYSNKQTERKEDVLNKDDRFWSARRTFYCGSAHINVI